MLCDNVHFLTGTIQQDTVDIVGLLISNIARNFHQKQFLLTQLHLNHFVSSRSFRSHTQAGLRKVGAQALIPTTEVVDNVDFRVFQRGWIGMKIYLSNTFAFLKHSSKHYHFLLWFSNSRAITHI